MDTASSGALSRAVAARAAHAVLTKGRSLEQALGDAGINTLEPRDRSLVKALVFGTLRTHLRNRAVLDLLAKRPFKKRDDLLVALLSVGIHALIDSRGPDYAVVSATVDASAQLGLGAQRGFINALLRRFLREQEALLQKAESHPQACWQHPQWLIDAIKTDWPDDWQSILTANNTQAPMWLRVNTRNGTRDNYLAELQAAGIAATVPLPGISSAVLLDVPVSVDELPGFANGSSSVQDAASQLAAQFLQASSGMRVLDACAAPGGKTCHVLERAADITLVAVDVAAERLERVSDNLARLNLSAQLVPADITGTKSWWDGEGFDRILLDAPCSATGVISRHPDIRYLRKVTDVAALAQQQERMLESIWPLLQTGGLLLYSTCSLLRAENEQVIGQFLKAHPEARERALECEPASLATAGRHGIQLLPGRCATDGFYYALIEKVAVDNQAGQG